MILERIHQIQGNLVRTYNIKENYVIKYYPWLGVLALAEFAIISTENRSKGYSMFQLVFGCDENFPKKYKVNWELIRLIEQVQINKYNIHKDNKIFDHDYKVRDKVILINIAA